MSDHFDNSFRGCLTKVLPYILFQKIYLYFGAGNGRPREPALCQLYRHSFVPYSDAAEQLHTELADRRAREDDE